MFRIESYITPILLSYITKYVKDFRTDDAQLSLWEGEVAFQNLELNLDVIQQDLNLPVEVIEGHIHELTLQVPWSKINSEPIKVTINTIELKIKLKSPTDIEKSTATNFQKKDSKPPPKHVTKQHSNDVKSDEKSSSGYIGSLVNKVINNVVIELHNIMFKYFEEDIVLSLNVQKFSIGQADPIWQPAFTEADPLSGPVRKLITISNFTICLDEVNASGEIEASQQPILHHCSLELRILLQSKTIRIGLSTQNIDLNISSLQFPMAMRLVTLITIFTSSSSSADMQSKSAIDVILSESIQSLRDSYDGQQSYLSWIWNMLPNFPSHKFKIFQYPQSKIQVQQNINLQRLENGKFTEIGIYLGNIRFALRTADVAAENSTKNNRQNLMFRITVSGIFSETLFAPEVEWFNTKIGIGKFKIETPKNQQSLPADRSFQCNELDVQQPYLHDSLFDHKSIGCRLQKFLTTVDAYLKKNSEEYLIFRGPCVAADVCIYRGPPELRSIQSSLLTTDVTEEKGKMLTKARIFHKH